MAKLHEADVQASSHLSLQLKCEKSAERADKMLLTLFFAFLFIPAILFWVIPDKDFSERENRQLASFPKLTFSTLISGEFMQDIPKYLADQFPARDGLVSLKALSEKALCRLGNNGVLYGKGGTLVTREDMPNTGNMLINLTAISAFADYCESKEIPVTVAITGRTADVLDSTLPGFYGSAYSDRLWATLDEQTADLGIPYINLRDPMRERAAGGEYVYYRTDHHWTTYGAYLATEQILNGWGQSLPPMNTYTWETYTDFYGTTYSTACSPWIEPDELLLFRYAGDTDYTTTILDTGKTFKGFYDESYLTKKDKYATFLSGNNALTLVQKDGENDRETLLVIKDSFAHSVAPFLAQYYDLVLVDLRYYKNITANLLTEYNISRVLVLYNIDSLTASSSSRLLSAGLK